MYELLLNVYKVTIQVVSNLQLISKKEVLISYEAYVLKHNLCLGVNGRFDTT